MNRHKKAVVLLLLLIMTMGLATSISFGAGIVGEDNVVQEALKKNQLINFKDVDKDDIIQQIRIAQPNYKLDTTAGITDGGAYIANAISNFFFSGTAGFSKYIAIVTEKATEFDLADKLGRSFDDVFRRLKFLTNIKKNPLMFLGFVLMLGAAVLALIKGRIVESIGVFGKVLLVFVITAAFFALGPMNIHKTFNTAINDMNSKIVRAAGKAELTERNYTAGGTYAKTVWVSMVDYPWQALEGGDSYLAKTPMMKRSNPQNMLEKAWEFIDGKMMEDNKEKGHSVLMRTFVRKGEERAKFIKTTKAKDTRPEPIGDGEEKEVCKILTPTDHESDEAWGQLADVLLISIINLVLGAAIALVSLLLLVLQFISLLLLLLFPLALALMMFPGYGMETFRKWATSFIFVWLMKVVVGLLLAIIFIFVGWGYTTLLQAEKSIFFVFMTILGILVALFLGKRFIYEIFGINPIRPPKPNIANKIRNHRSNKSQKQIANNNNGKDGKGINGKPGRDGAFTRTTNKIPGVAARRAENKARRAKVAENEKQRELERLMSKDKGVMALDGRNGDSSVMNPDKISRREAQHDREQELLKNPELAPGYFQNRGDRKARKAAIKEARQEYNDSLNKNAQEKWAKWKPKEEEKPNNHYQVKKRQSVQGALDRQNDVSPNERKTPANKSANEIPPLETGDSKVHENKPAPAVAKHNKKNAEIKQQDVQQSQGKVEKPTTNAAAQGETEKPVSKPKAATGKETNTANGQQNVGEGECEESENREKKNRREQK